MRLFQDSEQYECHAPGELSRLVPPIKDLRHVSLVIPTISSSNTSDLAEPEPDGLHGVGVGYHYFTQVTKPITAAFPVVELEQIKTALGMKVLAWQFFPFSSVREIRSNLHLHGRGQSILLMYLIHFSAII